MGVILNIPSFPQACNGGGLRHRRCDPGAAHAVGVGKTSPASGKKIAEPNQREISEKMEGGQDRQMVIGTRLCRAAGRSPNAVTLLDSEPGSRPACPACKSVPAALITSRCSNVQ